MYIDSPGKVTLQLRILRRRSDGYHDIRIAQAPVSVYDRLHLRPGGAPGIRLAVRSAQPLGVSRDNLVRRAALAFQAALGEPLALTVRLEKHIPVGAGLGGGSGNAAATLVALERLHGHPLGPRRLHALAAELGADVPFFLDPRPGWAEGRGERLRPLGGLVLAGAPGPLPALALLLVKPALSIATRDAYAAARAEADGGPAPVGDLAAERASDPGGEPDWGTARSVAATLFNAFEAALLPRYPELGRIRAALLGAGALGASLSGSGSVVYGLFADAPARDAALGALTGEAQAAGWRLLPCQTLAGHRYDFVF
jgi:4-diphosphocytidyl-2-C-methyl-D-erythritol kinase